jgi:hypothetical protein
MSFPQHLSEWRASYMIDIILQALFKKYTFLFARDPLQNDQKEKNGNESGGWFICLSLLILVTFSIV